MKKPHLSRILTVRGFEWGLWEDIDAKKESYPCLLFGIDPFKLVEFYHKHGGIYANQSEL